MKEIKINLLKQAESEKLYFQRAASGDVTIYYHSVSYISNASVKENDSDNKTFLRVSVKIITSFI